MIFIVGLIVVTFAAMAGQAAPRRRVAASAVIGGLGFSALLALAFLINHGGPQPTWSDTPVLLGALAVAALPGLAGGAAAAGLQKLFARWF